MFEIYHVQLALHSSYSAQNKQKNYLINQFGEFLKNLVYSQKTTNRSLVNSNVYL